MADQHPLTDEICRAIESDLTRKWGYDHTEFMCMRVGADWQLKRDVQWLKDNLHYSFYLDCDRDGVAKIDVDYVIEVLKEYMRPQQQQENNQ